MSDEQGDAEFEADLAGIPQGASPAAGAPSAPVAGTDARAVQELRDAIEELARRMGAGFREDLAQIRAIATAVADRDLTDDVLALRHEVGVLTARDDAGPVLDELGGVRAALERLATAGDLTGLRAEFAPLQATLDRIASRLDDDAGRSQVLARFESLEAKLDEQSQQLGRLAGDLRAHLADALGALDGDAVLAELAGLRRQLGTDRGTVVEQLQDHLADLASGEVVGALWDEVRALRDVVDAAAPVPPEAARGGADGADVLESLATLRAEVEGIGAGIAAVAEPVADPAVVGLREDVRGVHDEVRALGEAIAALDQAVADAAAHSAAPPAATAADTDEPGDEAGPVLAELTEELATLRAELAEGLVVEPSDALSASLDALRVEVDGLRASLAELSAAEPAATPAPSDPSTDLVATVLDELAGVRAGVDEVRDRLEQGITVEQPAPVPAPEPAPAVEVEVLTDELASLRDLVTSEVDGLRQAVVAAADRAVEAAAERSAGAPVVPSDVRATLDDATLEALRDEIRAAGAIGDQVVDALREELKALRRRIAVKAAERVLDDQQLAQIADAVAARLDQG